MCLDDARGGLAGIAAVGVGDDACRELEEGVAGG